MQENIQQSSMNKPAKSRKAFIVLGIVILMFFVLVIINRQQREGSGIPRVFPKERMGQKWQQREGSGIPRVFPEQTLEYFDATRVHPDARGFQLAKYESKRNRILFLPWGPQKKGSRPLSTLLAYDTTKDFFSPGSYRAVDLQVLLDDAAQGFGAGCLDQSSDWLYLAPFRKDAGEGFEQNGLAVRFNVTKDLSDQTAYEKFDVATLSPPPPHIGWAPCIFAEDYVYYIPVGQQGHIIVPHGIFLRYDTKKAFDDPASWEYYDLARVHPEAKGFQSDAVKLPYVYVIPFWKSTIVRYNVSLPFKDSSSYEAFDLATLNPDTKGYTGGIVAGDKLVLVPWRDLSRPPRQSNMSMVAAFNTSKQLNDPTAWQFFDLTQVHSRAKGYQFGWTDKDGFVHFVPTANFSIGKPPPFIVWDSSKSFTSPSSWNTYENPSSPPSTGAAYDPSTNTAWLAPYGINGDSGLITKIILKF